MQLKLDQLDTHLAQAAARGGLQPLYVLHGDEHLLAIEAADKIRAAARAAGFAEREVLVNDRAFRWNDLLGTARNLSLFGDRKLIELRIPTGKPGKDGSAALQEYAGLRNPSVLTLISLPKLDGTTKTSAWFRALETAGTTIEIPLVERARLPAWIGARLAAQGQSAAAAALDFVAERVEGNLLAAHQEIQKLALLYPAGKLTAEQVRDAVLNVARYDVFKLTEAMLAGDPARVVRMLDGLKAEGESAVLVHWTIAEEIRGLLRAHDGMRRGQQLPGLLRQLRVWGARERLYEGALRRLDPAKLKSALGKAAEVERSVKGLRVPGSGNIWDELARLGMMIAA